MINHEYKFIFVHIPKTGGTSMECCLGPNAWRNPQKYFIGEDLETNEWTTHYTLLQILKKFPQSQNYFKFAFVRNTWDRLLSAYMYYSKVREDKFSSIKEFLQKAKTRHTWSQLRYISDEDGKIKVDFIGRFEDIEKDFKIICDRIGVQTSLPHFMTTEHEHYSRYYDDETVDFISKKYADEISYFNYEFEPK
tara:strand:+ start:7941 stop:8519 length:579 start_codon:yes stop_codon:yes gene_type:complete